MISVTLYCVDIEVVGITIRVSWFRYSKKAVQQFHRSNILETEPIELLKPSFTGYKPRAEV